MVEPTRKLVFYKTAAGGEVVLDWLRALKRKERNIIGQDLMRAQFRWPIGMPLCRPLGDGFGKCAAISQAIALRGCCRASYRENSWP